jgi:Zn-dependent protease
VSKARLIYFVVFAILIATALLPALNLLPIGPHDGGQI